MTTICKYFGTKVILSNAYTINYYHVFIMNSLPFPLYHFLLLSTFLIKHIPVDTVVAAKNNCQNI